MSEENQKFTFVTDFDKGNIEWSGRDEMTDWKQWVKEKMEDRRKARNRKLNAEMFVVKEQGNKVFSER